ncbi:unnamed protein product [Haemonchus placei]|uniref:Transposase n=1 Tax=Haemonchus placei TaxID=6290 RepID=A0A0N4WY55_HAEPC|nr:unnamed protein product [Haemonchus placei]
MEHRSDKTWTLPGASQWIRRTAFIITCFVRIQLDDVNYLLRKEDITFLTVRVLLREAGHVVTEGAHLMIEDICDRRPVAVPIHRDDFAMGINPFVQEDFIGLCAHNTIRFD